MKKDNTKDNAKENEINNLIINNFGDLSQYITRTNIQMHKLKAIVFASEKHEELGKRKYEIQRLLKRQTEEKWRIYVAIPKITINDSTSPISETPNVVTNSGNIVPKVVNNISFDDKQLIEELTNHIGTLGPIIVVNSSIENIFKASDVNKMKRIFSGFQIEMLDWKEESYRSSQTGLIRSSHPFLSYICKKIYIIGNNPSISEDVIDDMIVSTLYKFILDTLNDSWTIIGDETGDFTEFKGGTNETPSSMCWLAIPPRSNLPSLDPEFHVASKSGSEQIAFENLLSVEGIKYITFSYSEGEKSSGLPMNEEDPHLDCWQDTLPLVVESLLEYIDMPTKINIFVEQVGPLESGSNIISPIIGSIKKTVHPRTSWNNMIFDQLWVVSKNPLEHPWLGYSDALGHVVRGNKKRWDDNITELANELRSRTLMLPYRKESLNGKIRQLLLSSGEPLIMLKSLSDIEARDMKDYVDNFFNNAIREAVDSLSEAEWQDLLEHIDTTSRDKDGQRAAAKIHNHVQLDKVMEKLSKDEDKFDFLRMMIGTSNHRGAIEQAYKCKSLIEELFANGLETHPDKIQRYNNLINGLKDNVFDFSSITDELPSYDKFMDEGMLRFLGTQAQTRGLTGNIKYIEKAIGIEEQLSKHGNDRRHQRRHYVLLAELLLESEKNIDAVRKIVGDLIDVIPEDFKELQKDTYFVSTLLKAGCLTNFNEDVFYQFTDTVLGLLDDDHPSQRIAYWCARWASKLDLQNTDIAKGCILHLESLTKIPLFTHDAPGIILSCELIDLSSRGYDIGLDAASFHQEVLKNSQGTTREWVASNYPNEDDWLAPLHFNYR